MSEQISEVPEIKRLELTERGLSDPLEFFYQHIDEFSEAEKVNLLALALELEEGAFEVQCALCATHADGRSLRKFIDQHNARARKEGRKVISYSYACHLARIGRLLREAGARMSRDFPALSPSYFIAALDAPDYIAALRHAQKRVADHLEDPGAQAKYSVRAFKNDIRALKDEQIKTAITSYAKREGLSLPEKDEAPETEAQHDATSPQFEADIQEAAEGVKHGEVAPYAHEPEESVEQEDANVRMQAMPPTCYDCAHCWQPRGHQRLGIVNVKGTAAIDLILEPVPVWICRKTKQVISVRTQVAPRAEAIAAGCGFFTPRDDESAEVMSDRAGAEELAGMTEAEAEHPPIEQSLSIEELEARLAAVGPMKDQAGVKEEQ